MIDIALANLSKLLMHTQLLNQAINCLENDSAIIGIILGGSVASGSPDCFSDLDLYIVVHDHDFERIFADKERIARLLGRIFFSFIADHNPGGDYDYIVLYENLVKVDFMYCQASEMIASPKWTKFLILKDTDGFLANLVHQSKTTDHLKPPATEVEVLNQKFWCWCWYVFGKIMRGELWEAVEGVNLIRSWAILPMLGWDANSPSEGYRRLEQKVDNQVAKTLELTIPAYEPESLFSALMQEIALFQELRDRVFARQKLSVNRRPELALVKEIEQQWATRDPA